MAQGKGYRMKGRVQKGWDTARQAGVQCFIKLTLVGNVHVKMTALGKSKYT